jgi:hypothetical protein
MPLPADYDPFAGPSRRRSQFRPCIDLHQGVVKQIVGGTLDLTATTSPAREDGGGYSEGQDGLKTNFVAAWVIPLLIEGGQSASSQPRHQERN